MYETIRIVNKLKPKYVLWENVKNLLSKKHIHNFKNYISIMNELGYNSYYQVLNSKNYGIPQNRERVFTLSIRQDIDNGTFTFPKPFELKLKLKDMLESEVDEKYFLSDKMIQYITKTGTKNFKLNDNKINLDIARPITTDPNKRAGTTNYLSSNLPNNYNLEQQDRYIEKKYENFIKKNGYIPEMFNPYNESEIKEIAPTQSTYCGSTTSSATTLIKNNTKLGYQVAVVRDGIDLENINSKTRRGRVQKGMIQTLDTQNNKGIVLNDLRIRKLTPKECWRLMGFDDSDFEKAEKVNSNAQLYKQAGNSIVVNVLEAILTNLFLKEENDFEGQMNFNMLGDQ